MDDEIRKECEYIHKSQEKQIEEIEDTLRQYNLLLTDLRITLETMKTLLTTLNESLLKLTKIITGNGEVTGVLTRMDRIEQVHKRVAYVSALIVSPVIVTLIVDVVLRRVFGQ